MHLPTRRFRAIAIAGITLLVMCQILHASGGARMELLEQAEAQ
jgi:hypothetical protein